VSDSSIPSLAAREITKRFGSLVANDRVDIEAYPGQVLALVGENGAGKSTLMNVLSGLLQPDGGQIVRNGQPVRFRSPRDSIAAGIGMVHQHFMLIPVFTVAENVVLGLEPDSPIMFNAREARRRVARLSSQYGLKLNPDDRVRTLPVGLQQRVEILKLLYRGSDILIFDEPTAVLTPQETDELFVVLRDLAGQGKTIIFITHKLKEVMAISDHITVLRLGKVVGNLVTAETNAAEITRYMIGRDVLPSVHKESQHLGSPVVELRNVRAQSDRGVQALAGVSFEVRAGEIFGIAGVEGNGQTELVEVLTGLRPNNAGEIVLYPPSEAQPPASSQPAVEAADGPTRSVRTSSIANKTPKTVRDQGVGYIPEDRRDRALVLPYSVADNLIFGMESKSPFSRLGVLNPAAIGANAKRLVQAFDIRPRRTDVPVGTLSGGNQQKVVLAREFSAEPRLLIASQPTRGLDVGAAEFVHKGLVEKRDQGVAVLLVSAELDEIMELSDRIAVLYEGRVMGIFNAGAVDENRLGLLMTGGEERAEELAIDLHAPALESVESAPPSP
jgi:general nucleoside transport system ATP-binding protein